MDQKRIDILLVEDSVDDAEMIIRVLKKQNLAKYLLHLQDGAEALSWLYPAGLRAAPKQNLPKVIILDLKLPKVNGLEVLKVIKSTEATKVIPVVIFTSSKEEKDIIDGYNFGLNSYVAKPHSYQRFTEVVSDLGSYWLLSNMTSHHRF